MPLGLWAWSLPRERRAGPALLAAASLIVWVAIGVEGNRAADGERVTADGKGTPSTTIYRDFVLPAPAGDPAGTSSTTTGAAASATSSTATTALAAPAPTTGATSPPTTSTSPTTTTTRPAGPDATTTTTTGPPVPGDGAALLARLRVAPEGPRTGYARSLFPHWIDADGDRCDTREEVLIAESTTPAQVDPYSCKVLAGDWISFYDGLTFSDPSELDVDHVVPLAEAWDSGASAWDTARRRAFANDLDHPEALRAVSASSNRSKGDLDPAQWKPTRETAWCQYARDWITVKVAWDLSADPDEVADLRVMLSTCPAG